MQEIYNRKQKLLLELNAKQAQHAKLTEELDRQVEMEFSAGKAAGKCIDRRCWYQVGTTLVLAVPCLGAVPIASAEGSVVGWCVTVACASWLAIGWKVVDKFYDWKYSAKINNLTVEYEGVYSRLCEIRQQRDKVTEEINGLKANIKGCDEELRMMSCLTKVKSQEKEIEAER